MSCFHPWAAARLPNGTVVKAGTPGWKAGDPLTLPCGTCFGCRQARSRHWAIRCTHEASLWDHNLFLTLTYDDAHLRWPYALDKKHLQGFLKNLRRRFDGAQPDPRRHHPIRFFASGEYGDITKRPHYHVLLYNLRLLDLEKYGDTSTTSPSLRLLWRHGSHLCEEVTPATIRYVAGYATKKVMGPIAPDYYSRTDPETGEWTRVQRPFNTMSRRPGVGSDWYHRYKRDLRRGHLRFDGNESSIPRFYETKYCADFPEEKDERDLQRIHFHQQQDPEESSERRLAEKEYVAVSNHKFFKKGEQQ